MPEIPVYLEEGAKCVFAVALEWPGWCRRAPDASQAVETLDSYRDRYARIVGKGPGRGGFVVVATLQGNATTDFGAPTAMGPWDAEPMTRSRLDRHLRILGLNWEYFDAVVRGAPESLRKGPRGGGRDRDAVGDHVREAERAYGGKVGARVPPRTPWPDQRSLLRAALAAQSETNAWPASYAIRRIAWHVADHAWEIEDRSAP